MSIEVKNIGKRFSNNFVALDDVSLKINPGELVALLGPSGSGKTTLLRIISGLESADSGQVLINGEDSSDKTVRDRNVGFVFQHYALFKHMTVFDNVAFGLRVRDKAIRPQEHEIQEQVFSLLKLVHLDAFFDRYPSQLSGGQRQRVALARALAVEPKVLLLDEPFGALDAKVRKELRRWMRRLHEEIHITSVFVTHDQEEAMEVADRVVVMSNGRIEQVGTPDQVYNNPANAFVYDFLGNYNEFLGWRDESGEVHLEDYEVDEKLNLIDNKNDGLIDFISNKLGFKKDPKGSYTERRLTRKNKIPSGAKPLKIYCRPHELHITKKGDLDKYLTAKVTHINSAGSLAKVELEDNSGRTLFAEVPNTTLVEESIMRNDRVFVVPKNIKVFDA